jgi:mono/diheme cytochrome c family protein
MSATRRKLFGLLIAVLACVLAVPSLIALAANEKPNRRFDYWQPDWMVRDLWGPGRMPKGMMVRLLRHTTYVNHGVPKKYEGAKSTLKPSPNVIADGQKLYNGSCVRCHGPNGMGDGASARALTPSPALLGYMIRRPISVDEYLLWTISDGGKDFGSEMPAFRETLSQEEIWKIIAYMRAGFPNVAPPSQQE